MGSFIIGGINVNAHGSYHLLFLQSIIARHVEIEKISGNIFPSIFLRGKLDVMPAFSSKKTSINSNSSTIIPLFENI